jgi:NDP-sugar pyrophosphorylase family protein
MSLGLATSRDGIHWARDPENPIFAGSWVEDVCVVHNEGIWFNIGSPAEYLEVHRTIAVQNWKPDYVTMRDWPVLIAGDATVDASAAIFNDVFSYRYSHGDVKIDINAINLTASAKSIPSPLTGEG